MVVSMTEANMKESTNYPSITVIICTINEAGNLPHVLPKIPDWI
jgi:hypothetical protein